MSVFRPSNINRRLVGTATTSTIPSCPFFSGKGSPGNGGQIGPKKTPYCCGSISLGCRFNGGPCGGVFKVNEARCGVKENCNSAITDCGFFICCGPSTTKWFVAHSCAQVCRTWNTRSDAVTFANSCLGSCGWFVPEQSTLQNPGACCISFWDTYTPGIYWSNTHGPSHASFGILKGGAVHMPSGGVPGGSHPRTNNVLPIRAFRCSAT